MWNASRMRNHVEISRVFFQHSQKVFTSLGARGIDACLAGMTAKVDGVMKEVDKALSQMHLLKASGPDGFGVSFYQQHWFIVGGDNAASSSECLQFRYH